MMRHHVLKSAVCILIANFIICNAIGISPKLDFSDEASSSRLISGLNNERRVVLTSSKNDDGIKEEFGEIGVICVSGNCKNTKGSIEADVKKSKDSIHTDVVVHVKTNVDIDNNSKNNQSIIDETPDVPVIVGSSTLNDNNQNVIQPVISTTEYMVLSSLVPIVSEARSDSYPQNFVPIKSHINVNIESLTSEGRDVDNHDTFEYRMPHFEPFYHRHYYGENQPPPVFYPKSRDKASFWPNPTAPHKYHVGQGVTCLCNNEVPRGLQWHPRRAFDTEPGRNIDDKLAPLN